MARIILVRQFVWPKNCKERKKLPDRCADLKHKDRREERKIERRDKSGVGHRRADEGRSKIDSVMKELKDKNGQTPAQGLILIPTRVDNIAIR